MENKDIDYASTYQLKHNERAKEKSAVFLPMEGLKEFKTNKLHLSVSFSGTGSGDIYFSKMVALYRAVKIKYKWLIIPTTISKVFDKVEFESVFGDLLEIESVEGEEFWVIREKDIGKLSALIEVQDLNNSFRELYLHDYFPE